ncbi:glutamate ABC transporter substrate-binding protein [Streptomonospora litoralis]|uniref:ABC transporter glutamine-binding protein GlnH n=1 Tax=Streptomonospora litoralis TaxID=2498135 RepID=A0A4V0ZKB3_9ACTN|nr:glutamate ABC transporter substrate-binding protein [Streptomonospora litoralis]QBI56382.1 ABC transporter glutamine-binding protein GlnH precursor [Streptomonospora litoralis]
MPLRRLVSAAAAAAVLAAAAACTDTVGVHTSVADATALRIGVKTDQPGLGLRTDGGDYEGFDVDVALYIADELGVPRESVEFVGVTSRERERVLVRGKVDLVLATYSITQLRKTVVTFGGPYYVAHQDILVRAGDTSVDGVADLAGKRLCQGAGSNSANRVIEEREVAAVRVERPDYSDCIDLLAEGEVDAVSTDDLILAGYLATAPASFRLVNAPFTSEKYGVGVAKEDLAGCEAVNRAITRMYQDGTAAWLLRKWFGDTGLDLNTSVPQFEGCG